MVYMCRPFPVARALEMISLLTITDTMMSMYDCVCSKPAPAISYRMTPEKVSDAPWKNAAARYVAEWIIVIAT